MRLAVVTGFVVVWAGSAAPVRAQGDPPWSSSHSHAEVRRAADDAFQGLASNLPAHALQKVVAEAWQAIAPDSAIDAAALEIRGSRIRARFKSHEERELPRGGVVPTGTSGHRQVTYDWRTGGHAEIRDLRFAPEPVIVRTRIDAGPGSARVVQTTSRRVTGATEVTTTEHRAEARVTTATPSGLGRWWIRASGRFEGLEGADLGALAKAGTPFALVRSRSGRLTVAQPLLARPDRPPPRIRRGAPTYELHLGEGVRRIPLETYGRLQTLGRAKR